MCRAARSPLTKAARTALATLLAVAASSAFAQSTSLPGSLSGSQSFNASSGSATITGNATLSGATTLSLNFGVEYLVVGGGGSGAQARVDGAGGGGGAGGYRSSVPGALSGSNSAAEPILAFTSSTSASVIVGKGGAGAGTAMGNNGDDSSFAGIVALGGGGGAGSNGNYYVPGASGGSGGGSTDGNQVQGAGTAGQGFAGGRGFSGATYGGGGGGAGGAGGNASSSSPGVGGAGLSSWITGSSVQRAQGGAGRYYINSGTASASGAANTGNGGQGGQTGQPGGSGGTGIVIARYFGSQFATGGSATVGTGSSAGYTVHQFTTTAGVTSTTSFVLPNLDNRLAATVTGNLSGTGGLTVNGPGALTLAGANSYTGPTSVNTRLFVNGTLGNTAVTVNSFGLLGGSGLINGSVSVLSGGTFSPGNSPGLLTLGSSLTLAGTTLMEIDGLNRGSLYDGADVGGSLTYGGAMLIVFNSSLTTAYADNTVFDFFNFASQSGSFTSITTASNGAYYGGLTFTQSGDKWTAAKGAQTVEYTQSTGNLVVVPEPLTLGLTGLGIVAAIMARRMTRPGRRAAA